MRVKLGILRTVDPTSAPVCCLIWNWRAATMRLTKWQKYGSHYTIKMTPGIPEREYRGTQLGYWHRENPKHPDYKIEVSSVDAILTVRDPPAWSEIRIIFTFLEEEEFDYNILFQWVSSRFKHMNRVTLKQMYYPTIHHRINGLKIEFTDNYEAIFPDGADHSGQVYELGTGELVE